VFNSYIITKGDVLYDIASRHGTTTGVLIELNTIEDPNLIEVGQVIALSKPALDPQPRDHRAASDPARSRTAPPLRRSARCGIAPRPPDNAVGYSGQPAGARAAPFNAPVP
jgi:LysM repeat protein